METIQNDLDTQQSMKSTGFLLDNVKFEHNNQCRAEFGIVAGNDVSQTKASLVDVENDLRGTTRTSNKCVEHQYVPTQSNTLEPINYIKCVDNPSLDLNKVHLKSCNFFDYQEVPKEPKLQFDRCDYAKF